MSRKCSETPRRGFLNSFLKDAFRFTLEIKKDYDEGKRIADILSTLDDYPIAHTYPWELFEGEAKRLGIDIDEVGKTEAIKRIVAAQMLGRNQ